MQTIILVDAHSLGYAAQAAVKLTVGGREVQAIFGFVNRVRELLLKYENATPLILWDGKSHRRLALYPEYKGKRDTDPKLQDIREKFREQKPDIKRGLELLGITQFLSETSEADDLAGYLVKSLPFREERRIVLHTGDRDWWQLIGPNVVWHDARQDRYVHHDTFLDMTGYKTPQAFIEGKALQGDTSDNIPPTGGIGETGAPEFLARFGSAITFVKDYRAGKFDGEKVPKAWRDLATNQPHKTQPIGRFDCFIRNLKLMSLLNVAKPADLQVQRTHLNPEAFYAFCESLNFRSITSQFDNWTAPFKK